MKKNKSEDLVMGLFENGKRRMTTNDARRATDSEANDKWSP